jgi:hypothetical protein
MIIGSQTQAAREFSAVCVWDPVIIRTPAAGRRPNGSHISAFSTAKTVFGS